MKAKFSFLIGIFLLFFTGNAFSIDVSELFSPESKDTDIIIHQVLTPLFGYNMSFEERSAISSISEPFLHGLLTIAVFIIIWQKSTGILKSTSGEVLGRKATVKNWSIRLSLGGLFIFPIGSSGLSFIQHLLVWFFAHSILFANTINENFYDKAFEGRVYFNAKTKDEIFDGLKKIFLGEVCFISGQHYSKDKVNGSGENYIWKSKITEHKTGDITINYGYMSSSSRLNSACGSVNIGKVKFIDLAKFSNLFDIVEEKNLEKAENYTGLNGSYSNKIFFATDEQKKSKESYSLAHKIVYQTQGELLLETIKELRALAHFYVKETNSYDVSKSRQPIESLREKIHSSLSTIINNYFTKLTARFKEKKIFEFNEDTLKEMKKEGFASAGTWYFRISVALYQVNEMANQTPSINYSLYSKDLEKTKEDVSNAMAIGGMYEVVDYSESVSTAHSSLLNKISPEIYADVLNADKMLEAITRNFIIYEKGNVKINASQKLTKENLVDEVIANNPKFKELYTISSFEKEENDKGMFKENSLFQIQSTGIIVSSIAIGALLAVIGVLAFTSMTTAATIITPFLFAILSAILVPSLMMAFYIPLVPFILWMGVVFGCLILLFEALVGSLLLGLALLVPDQDGIIGRQGQAFMLAFSILLKAPLAILGLNFADYLINAMLYILNRMWNKVTETITSDVNALSFLLGWTVLFFVFFIVVNRIVSQGFGIFTRLSDDVLKYMGTHGSGILGQISHGIEGGISSGSATAIGSFVGVTQGGQESLRQWSQQRQNRQYNANADGTKNKQDLIGNLERSEGLTDKENALYDEKYNASEQLKLLGQEEAEIKNNENLTDEQKQEELNKNQLSQSAWKERLDKANKGLDEIGFIKDTATVEAGQVALQQNPKVNHIDIAGEKHLSKEDLDKKQDELIDRHNKLLGGEKSAGAINKDSFRDENGVINSRALNRAIRASALKRLGEINNPIQHPQSQMQSQIQNQVQSVQSPLKATKASMQSQPTATQAQSVQSPLKTTKAPVQNQSTATVQNGSSIVPTPYLARKLNDFNKNAQGQPLKERFGELVKPKDNYQSVPEKFLDNKSDSLTFIESDDHSFEKIKEMSPDERERVFGKDVEYPNLAIGGNEIKGAKVGTPQYDARALAVIQAIDNMEEQVARDGYLNSYQAVEMVNPTNKDEVLRGIVSDGVFTSEEFKKAVDDNDKESQFKILRDKSYRNVNFLYKSLILDNIQDE